MDREQIIKHLEEVKAEIELIIPESELIAKMSVCGGSIRSMVRDQKIADYDIFLPDESSVQELREALAFRTTLYDSKNSIGLITATGKHIQFIICAVGQPWEIISEFDFTCNMNYYMFANLPSVDPLVVHSDTYHDQLVVNPNARNAVGTLLRVGKFVGKGYKHPSRSDMVGLAIKISRLDPITHYSHLEEYSRMNFNEEEVSSLVGTTFSLVIDKNTSSNDRVGSNGGA